MVSEAIQLAFAIYDKTGDYARHAAVSMISVFDNTTSKVHVHILHDETLLWQNRNKLELICKKYGHRISFYSVKIKINLQKYPALQEFSIGIMFRLKLPEILPDIDKVIYLDSDIVCMLDIFDLWREDISNSPIGIVSDPCTNKLEDIPLERMEFYRMMPIMNEKYFNSGVLYLNLQEIRLQKYNLFEDCVKFLNAHSNSSVPDQDALNFLFQEKGKFLNEKYNRLVPYCSDIKEESIFQHGAIWHFAGSKPWIKRDSRLDVLYWKYLRLTPWNEDYDIGRIYDAFFYEGNFDLLEWRLSILYKVVDYFVLVTGGEFVNIFDEIKQHFPQFLDKIIFVVTAIPEMLSTEFDKRKILQNNLYGVLQNFNGNDLILISETEMIPAPNILEQLSAVREILIKSPMLFEQEAFHQREKVKLNKKCAGTIISRKCYINSIRDIIDKKNQFPKIHGGGWYFIENDE